MLLATLFGVSGGAEEEEAELYFGVALEVCCLMICVVGMYARRKPKRLSLQLAFLSGLFVEEILLSWLVLESVMGTMLGVFQIILQSLLLGFGIWIMREMMSKIDFD